MTLAQTATQSSEFVDLFKPFMETLGVPGAIVVLFGYTLRKIVIWSMPRVERIVQAHISRQNTMEECHKKLTEETVMIQKKNHELLIDLHAKFPTVCQKPFPG